MCLLGLVFLLRPLRGALIVAALATALGFAVIGTQNLPLAVLVAYASWPETVVAGEPEVMPHGSEWRKATA